MSSSQDNSLSPVAIRAPALSPPGVSDEPASLCEICREAHHAALRDDDPHWVQLNGHVQLMSNPTSLQPLLMDEWPNLPGLRESARRGCGFCALLREAILSDKFKDAWDDFAQGSDAKAGRKRLSLELWYDKDLRPDLSFPRLGAWNTEYLTVRGKFEEELKFHLHFELEGIIGEYPGIQLWLLLSLLSSILLSQTSQR